MLDSLMTKPNYADLAKQTNGIGAAFSTVFWLTRIWARMTQYKGLWWDDYLLSVAWAFQLVGNGLCAAAPSWGFNVLHNSAVHGWTFIFASSTFWYLAMAFAKTAFVATMLRLSRGRVKVAMCLLLLVVWAFTVALTIASWLNICEQRVDVSLTSTCVPLDYIIRIHLGNAIATICFDVTLACMPWYILSKVYISKNEKWGVACSMSLTGFAAVVCIVRSYLISYCTRLAEQGLDYSYGAFMAYGLCQAEITIYIVAQTMPLLRVLYLGDSKSSHRNSEVTSVVEIDRNNKSSKAQTKETKLLEPVRQASIELLQLPSGKIVAAESEEGQQFRAALPEPSSHRAAVTSPSEQVAAAPRASAISIDDEVHKLWADMGLSRRAWSLSHESSPHSETIHRHYI